MDSTVISRLFHNWQRKLVAIVSAIIIWLFVDNSITETKTIPNVPIRIVNLPPDKTVVGLLPNRLLSKRVTLTLSGTKEVIQELEPGDLEVLLDVSTADSNEWVVQINKKNLVSLNPSIDLTHHITQVAHSEFVLKLSPLVSAKIPIRVTTIGEAPNGYEYLDVWPQKLIQTVSGSSEEIDALKTKGLELVLNLNEISKADLDNIRPGTSPKHDDEIGYAVPDKWKKVAIAFHNNAMEEINDPEAQPLRIDFLRKSFLLVSKEIPISVFYPIKYSSQINANTHPLAVNNFVKKQNDVTVFGVPVYVRDVSRLFLDIVNENLIIIIEALPKTEREVLQWSLEVVNPQELEDNYVAHLLSSSNHNNVSVKWREAVLRKRFKDYLQRLVLYIAPDQKLHLHSILEPNSIKVIVVK
jgi:hypothetical protein